MTQALQPRRARNVVDLKESNHSVARFEFD